MSSRSVRLAFALGVSLTSGTAWAQQINRGPMAVVGLRAPDGDVDAATTLTNTLRESARTAGYQVPDGTPAFDQEFAMVGCSSTSPECLSLIANDIHAQKYIYGTVQRIGRGRNAQLSVEVSLWDDATHREIHREAATIASAQARPDALRALAQQMFVAIGNRDMSAQQETLRTQQAEAARQAQAAEAARIAQQQQQQLQQAQQQLRTRTVIQRSHVLRYVGLGVLGLGVVAGAVGVWQVATTSSQHEDAVSGTSEQALAWRNYENTVNYPVNGTRPLRPDQVCARAATDASSNPEAAQANSLCSANSTSQALAYAFGIGGIVLAGVGAALVIIDSLNSGSANEGQPQPGAAPSPTPARPRASLRVAPVLNPSANGVNGVNLSLTF